MRKKRIDLTLYTDIHEGKTPTHIFKVTNELFYFKKTKHEVMKVKCEWISTQVRK